MRNRKLEGVVETVVKEPVVVSVGNVEDVEGAEDAANRSVVTKEEQAMGAKSVGHDDNPLDGRGVDSAEDLAARKRDRAAVGRIEDSSS